MLIFFFKTGNRPKNTTMTNTCKNLVLYKIDLASSYFSKGPQKNAQKSHIRVSRFFCGLFVRTLSVWYYQVYMISCQVHLVEFIKAYSQIFLFTDILPSTGSNVHTAPGCLMPYQSSNLLWRNDSCAYFSRSTRASQKNANFAEECVTRISNDISNINSKVCTQYT